MLIKLPNRLNKVFPGRLFPVENSDFVVPSIEIENIVLSRQIVANSDALGAGAPFQIKQELAEGSLVIIPVSEPWMRFNYGFIYLRDRMLSPAARTFIKLVREVEKGVGTQNEALIRHYLRDPKPLQ